MSDVLPAAAPTAQTIRPALFLLVPLFTAALVVLALSHRPQGQGPRPYSTAKRQVRIAYAVIGALAVLSTLAGALPLSHASNAQAEALIQTLLSLLLGVPVLHLPASYVRPKEPQLITRIVHTGLLVIFLSSATLLALLAPFLPPSHSAVPLYLHHALFLVYTLIAVPRVAGALFAFVSPPELTFATPTRPITIHVATHRTSIPLTLPSPASSASFPFSHDHDDQELEIAHPPRGHRHEKIASVDSSTSTITAVDVHTRRSIAAPPLAHHSVPSPPSSDVEHQRAHLIPNDATYPGAQAHLRAQLVFSRSRSLLVFLVAAQLTVLAAYACALAANIPSSSGAAAVSLGIAQTVCTVLGVTGTMSAYLLHAYNTHLSPKPPSTQHIPEDVVDHPRSGDNNNTAIQMLEVQVDRNARHRPVLIQLAPTVGQRRRIDARLNLPKLSPVRKEDFEQDKSAFGFGLRGYDVDVECCSTPVHPSSAPGLLPPPPAVPSSPLSPLTPMRFSEDAVSPTTPTMHEPIILTYEPPLGERSLFETTDTEAGRSVGGARSLFSSLSLSSMKSGSLKRALSSSAGAAVAGPSNSQHDVKRASTLATGGGRSKSRRKRHAEDPAAYIKKRGSLPAPASSSKKLFGWEFGWDPLPLPSGTKSATTSSAQALMESVDVDESFIDLDGTWELGHGRKGKEVSRERESRKLKRNTTGELALRMPSTPTYPSAPMPTLMPVLFPSFGEKALEVQAGVGRGPSRKLKKRTGSRPGTAETAASSNGFSHRHSSSGLPNSANVPVLATTSTAPAPPDLTEKSFVNLGDKPPHRSPCAIIAPCLVGLAQRRSSRRAQAQAHRRVKSGASTATSDSGVSGISDGAGREDRRTSEGGLRLKSSFKMGVGRTLGPGLTLAAAAASVVRIAPEMEGERKRAEVVVIEEGGEVVVEPLEDEEDGYVDVEEEGETEMSSIVAAKLVSVSIARATPAATIVAPPVQVQVPPYRTLPALLTSTSVTKVDANTNNPSSPISPTSAKSGWKPHPFAESRESFGVYTSEEGSHESSGQPTAEAEDEDEVLQLEREMFGLGRSGTQGSAPGTPTIATPTLSILRLQPELGQHHGQSRSQSQMPTPDPTPEKTIFKSKSKTSLKTSSSSLKHRSEWMPVSSSSMPSSISVATSSSGSGSGSTTKGDQGFPYKFPTFFPASIRSASESTPPPPPTPTLSFLAHPHTRSSSHSQSQTKTQSPGTPRGATLRLSTMTMGSVRSAFAGVGARMSGATSRMSVNSGAGGSTRSGLGFHGPGPSVGGGHAFGQMIMEDDDDDGDFMDLRDPFASPPPSQRAGKARDEFFLVDDGIEDVFGGYSANATRGGVVTVGAGKKMSAWGRLPMPVRSLSSPAGGGAGGAAAASVKVRPSKSHGDRRKHRKEKRTRKTTMPGLGTAKSGPGALAPAATPIGAEEDVDFDIEEALLAQRLLKRLDSAEWEGRV